VANGDTVDDFHRMKSRPFRVGGQIPDNKIKPLGPLLDALVFTLPHTLNQFILNNKKVMLDLLFQAVMEVLTRFALDPQWRL